MRYFHPNRTQLIHECASLLTRSKLDSYLFVERFIEKNKNLFVKDAQLLFATQFLNEAYGRDWEDWFRQTGAFFKGGYGEVEKSKADINYSYNQAVRHINQMMSLITSNPEADDPKILNAVRMQLQNVLKSFEQMKPNVDVVAPKIMNVAFNKFKGINTPLASSIDMTQLKSIKDKDILGTIARMLSDLANPSTNPDKKSQIQTQLNLIKGAKVPFTSYADPNFTNNKYVKSVIKWKDNNEYWTTLPPDQQALLTKFFGNEAEAQLAFAKFKYFRGLATPTERFISSRQVPPLKNKLDQIVDNFIKQEFLPWWQRNSNSRISRTYNANFDNQYKELSKDPSKSQLTRFLQDKNILEQIRKLFVLFKYWKIDKEAGASKTRYDEAFASPPTKRIKIQSADLINNAHATLASLRPILTGSP